ncbi:unnamed protein product [Heterobilharzia americana]|nr:unnamed protein product [Heterobilharzia americana]
MVKAQLIRFHKLVICLRERFKDPHYVNDASVLQHIPKVAVLLRGWWVAKSEILYPPNSYSEHSGVPSALLIRARDYIMAVFHRGEHLTRKTISCMTKLPTVEATEMLKALACKMSTSQKGCANHWEFHPTDYDFIKKHPDIVQQQDAAWEIRIRQLCTQLKLEQLVSDGVRRKTNSGRRSSECNPESESGFHSLVSGVHVSTLGKIANRGKRMRQMSECQVADAAQSVNALQPSNCKRIRTQSLSSSYSSGLSPPPSKIPRIQADVKPSEFCTPTCPPRIKSPSPSRRINDEPFTETPENSTPGNPLPSVNEHTSSQRVVPKPESHSPEASSPPAASLELDPVKVKVSSSPQDLSQTANTDSGCHEPSNEIDSNAPSTDSLPSIHLVKNILNTQPIVALSELTKIYQQQLGSLHSNFYPSPWKDNPPPPGSEYEREFLKTHLLEALKTIGARQLTVRWPTIPTALEEEPLFVTQVAGQECGAVSESIAQFRDAILDLYESVQYFLQKECRKKRCVHLSNNIVYSGMEDIFYVVLYLAISEMRVL